MVCKNVIRRNDIMKNPNGYGSIVKLAGNRRKPWAVRITEQIDKNTGKQIYRYIAYFEQKKDAVDFLSKLRDNPIIIRTKMTFLEVYEEWSIKHFANISKSTTDCYKAAYLAMKELYNMPFLQIRTFHMQKIIDSCNKSHSTKEKMKLLLNQMYKYALENDIINKNYAEFIILGKYEKTEKEIFTDLEIQKLFDNVKIGCAVDILILIYTGFRIQELLNLSKFDIDFHKKIITGGLKTQAGKNRIVPIHPKIETFLQEKCSQSKGLLYPSSIVGRPMDAKYFRETLYYPTLEQLGLPRKTPHTTRHTCATLMARSGVDPVAIKQILGHTDYAFTVNNYTHKDTDFLYENLKKMH